jgi:hypothetical protein
MLFPGFTHTTAKVSDRQMLAQLALGLRPISSTRFEPVLTWLADGIARDKSQHRCGLRLA